VGNHLQHEVLNEQKNIDSQLTYVPHGKNAAGEISMNKILLATLASVLYAGHAVAQAPAPTIAAPPTNDEVRAPRPARARGIAMALAVEGAQRAIAACLEKGYKVTALVVDSAGVPIALISGDGAAAITQRIAMGKAQAVLKTKMSSGEAAAKAKSDSAFMAQLTGDPLVGTPRQGGIPIMIGGEMVGAFAVSGAPGGDKDEPCAIAGLDKIQERLK
jgi:uncharacterized protein GlcG (DUF336 family)